MSLTCTPSSCIDTFELDCTWDCMDATLQVIDSDGSGTVSASIAGIDYAVSQVCERLRR